MSACTNDVFRRYWQTGNLPLPGTKCGVSEKPFGLEKRAEDKRLLEMFGDGIDIGDNPVFKWW